MKKTQSVTLSLILLIVLNQSVSFAQKKQSILFHLKTSLDHDDAQLCVAYNEIWAALEEKLEVYVLIDADAVKTYKVDWLGKDDFESYNLPEGLKETLSNQFNYPLEKIPQTYGAYLKFLNDKGAHFCVNATMLGVAGIDNISAKFFKPINLKEMIKLRTSVDFYLVY